MGASADIGKIFRKKREERGVSIEEAYRKSRIHFNVITDIEDGVFDKLDKLYVKSFLKKYSEFLGLDTGSILKEYESVSSRIPRREFTLDVVEERQKKDQRPKTKDQRPKTKDQRPKKDQRLKTKDQRPKEDKRAEKGEQQKWDIRGNVLPLLTEKRLGTGLKTVFAILIIVLSFVLIGRVKDKLSLARKGGNTAVLKSARVTRDAAEKTSARSVRKTASSRKEVIAASAGKPAASGDVTSAPVVLTVKARGEVWMQVKDGTNVIFDGFLNEGDSKTWRSTGTLTVWTGKTEMLDFIVNTRKVGEVARGVVRNIMVSAGGIKVGDDWVTRF